MSLDAVLWDGLMAQGVTEMHLRQLLGFLRAVAARTTRCVMIPAEAVAKVKQAVEGLSMVERVYYELNDLGEGVGVVCTLDGSPYGVVYGLPLATIEADTVATLRQTISRVYANSVTHKARHVAGEVLVNCGCADVPLSGELEF